MTYDFKCNSCGHKFTLNLSYEAYLLALDFNCPRCDSTNVRRLYEIPPSVHFKGDGFTKSPKDKKE